MKTLYSSTFLSVILAFFTLLGIQGEPAQIVKSEPIPVFSNIFRPDFQPVTEFENEPIVEEVNIEAFYTFGCRDCKGFSLNTVPALYEKYTDNEDVNLEIYLNPNTEDAGEYYPAVGVKCAEEYEKYWEMHSEIASTPEPLSFREVDLIGQGLELPVTGFRSCLKSGKYDEFIGAVNDVANEKGVTKMPVIYINDYVLTGEQPIENIDRIVKEILSR